MSERARQRIATLIHPIIAVLFVAVWLSIFSAHWADSAKFLDTNFDLNAHHTGSAADVLHIILGAAPVVVIGLAMALSRARHTVALTLSAIALVLGFIIPLASSNDGWGVYLGVLYVFVVVTLTADRQLSRRMLWIGLACSLIPGLWLLPTVWSRAARHWWGVEGLGPGELFVPIIWRIVLSAALIALSWWMVQLIRGRADDQEQLAELERDLHSAEDQASALAAKERISRDVHDIMAHSLAVITAQADGARYQLGSTEPAADAPAATETLANIAAVSREALIELRQVLDGIDETNDADERVQADLDIALLCERMGQAGLSVALSQDGQPPALSHAVQLALYRIVQEALTNALRHGAAGGAVEARLTWTSNGVNLRVESELAAIQSTGGTASTPRMGRGVRGMAERARLVGGWVATEIDPSSRRHIVTGALPYRMSATTEEPA